MAMQYVYMRKAYTMNTMYKYECICSLVPPAYFGLCYISTRQRGGVDQERRSPRNPRVYVVVFIGCNKSCILLFPRLLFVHIFCARFSMAAKRMCAAEFGNWGAVLGHETVVRW